MSISTSCRIWCCSVWGCLAAACWGPAGGWKGRPAAGCRLISRPHYAGRAAVRVTGAGTRPAQQTVRSVQSVTVLSMQGQPCCQYTGTSNTCSPACTNIMLAAAWTLVSSLHFTTSPPLPAALAKDDTQFSKQHTSVLYKAKLRNI